MTANLLLVTLGPVQEFIAQARRTRDLWHSSHLLSELSRAAARSLAKRGARLIIPALDLGDRELLPCWGFERYGTDSAGNTVTPFAIANKIYAEVGPDADVEEIAIACREDVYSLFRQHADWVRREKVAELLDVDVDEAWAEQVDSLIEFTAGWMPVIEGEFGEVRRRLDAAMAARKQLREFNRWRAPVRHVPKSSLCGARDTVIPPKHEQRVQSAPKLVREHGISEQEQLDAIGLIKRAGGLPDHFTPIINIALSPWLRAVDPDLLAAVARACASEQIQRFDDPLPCTANFGFEASVLLPTRWDSLAKEKGTLVSAALREAVETLHRAGPTMREPYVACLVADGDRAGDAIATMRSSSELREFSAKLSTFARGARKLVEQQYRGSLVYAGGDDVLAFVPLDTALDCANALRTTFEEQVGHGMTLSVGLGVGHYMESMGELLELGRAAEKLAKVDRNTLAILVDKRSGGRRYWSQSWCRDPVATLRSDLALFDAGLSTRKIHEIADTLARLPAEAHEGFATLLADEVNRSLRRVELGQTERHELADLGPIFGDDDDYLARRRIVRDWIDRLLIAREFKAYPERPR